MNQEISMRKHSSMKIHSSMKNYGIIKIHSRNCLEIAPRALLLAAAVILTVVLISVMVAQFKSAQEMVNVSSELISQRTDDIRNSEILELDGMEVRGSDVLNVCKRELGEGIKITLKNGGTSKTYTDSASIDSLRDYESSEYVKPLSSWKCNVLRNKNGIITEVIFTKK